MSDTLIVLTKFLLVFSHILQISKPTISKLSGSGAGDLDDIEAIWMALDG